MKILISARNFIPPFTGGVDVYAERLGQALAGLGHQVVFVALDSSSNSGGSAISIVPEEYAGFPVKRIRFAFAGRPKQAFDLAYDAEMGQVFEKVLQTERPDFLCVLNFYTLSLSAVEAAKKLGIPVVHIATDFIPICRRATFIRWNGESCRAGESLKSCSECFVSHNVLGRLAAGALNFLPEEGIQKIAQRPYKFPHPLSILNPYWDQAAIMAKRLEVIGPLRRMIDLVITPTRFTAELFLANGFEPGQVQFLPFAVEKGSPLENVQKTAAGNTRFLFIGRLQPYKGAHVLVEAFNKLRDPQNATLTIVGKADGYDEYFTRLLAEIESNENIHFAGSIPPEELGGAFANTDYFVIPSVWHENNPLILLDALQSNTPVIASDIGGVRDVVKHDVNGFLFPMGDAAALRQIMQNVIDSPGLLEKLRPSNDLLEIDAYAQKILELFRSSVRVLNGVPER